MDINLVPTNLEDIRKAIQLARKERSEATRKMLESKKRVELLCRIEKQLMNKKIAV